MDHPKSNRQPAELVRQRPKVLVTVRLDAGAKDTLVQIAGKEGGTISEQIDKAVREYLERRFLAGGLAKPGSGLRVRHALLPDTSVLAAFDSIAGEEAANARTACRLSAFEFRDSGTQWRRLPDYLNSAQETDLLESVNWSAIFSIMKEARSSPALDWVGPYLQLFAGHCVFVGKELLARGALTEPDIVDFVKFRSLAQTARELSLRSVVAWLRQSKGERVRRTAAVESLWKEAMVTCQLGTDYEIAVKRVWPILAQIHGGNLRDTGAPRPRGDDSVADFLTGVVEGFSGNLLHSSLLLTKPDVFLLAGPADLRIQSINVLAGRKGMFVPSAAGSESTSFAQGDLGQRVLDYWRRAVLWFRTSVIGPQADPELLRRLVNDRFGEVLRQGGVQPGNTWRDDPVEILRGLMQSWVKWFADPAEAEAYLGSDGTKRLVQSYERLCDMLNPLRNMTAPIADPDDPDEEQSLWKFPILPVDVGDLVATERTATTVTSGANTRGKRTTRRGRAR